MRGRAAASAGELVECTRALDICISKFPFAGDKRQSACHFNIPRARCHGYRCYCKGLRALAVGEQAECGYTHVYAMRARYKMYAYTALPLPLPLSLVSVSTLSFRRLHCVFRFLRRPIIRIARSAAPFRAHCRRRTSSYIDEGCWCTRGLQTKAHAAQP